MELDGIDLTDLERFAEGFPHDVFRQLRRDAPVWWQEPTEHTPDGVGFWVVSRHADVRTAAADATTFSSERGPGQDGGGTIIQDLPYGFAAGVLLNMTDDPRHQRIRKLLAPAVTPWALARMEAELRARTAAILDAVADDGRCDFLRQVAVELPVQATLALLGVPNEDRHQLVRWTNATLAYEDRELGEETDDTRDAAACRWPRTPRSSSPASGASRPTTSSRRSSTPRSKGPTAASRCCPRSSCRCSSRCSSRPAARRPATPLPSAWPRSIEHPEQLAAVDADRSLLDSATEEILRWSSPTLYNRRTATADVELAGTPVAAGAKVTLWWASADFDETVFDDPFRFDIRRQPNPHLAFGHRVHFCLGAALARLEIRIMLDQLLTRFTVFALDGPIRRVRTNKHAGVAQMPVRFERRPR